MALLGHEKRRCDAGLGASRAGADYARAAERVEKANAVVGGLRQEIGGGVIDQDFFGREPAELLGRALDGRRHPGGARRAFSWRP